MSYKMSEKTGGRLSDKPSGNKGRARRSLGKIRYVYLCLLIPFAGLLWTPLYNRIDPELFGIPFFYWYQMLWTFLTAITIVPVYLHEESRRR